MWARGNYSCCCLVMMTKWYDSSASVTHNDNAEEVVRTPNCYWWIYTNCSCTTCIHIDMDNYSKSSMEILDFFAAAKTEQVRIVNGIPWLQSVKKYMKSVIRKDALSISGNWFPPSGWVCVQTISTRSRDAESAECFRPICGWLCHLAPALNKIYILEISVGNFLKPRWKLQRLKFQKLVTEWHCEFAGNENAPHFGRS